MKQFNHMLLGMLCGIVLPAVFIWLYVYNLYRGDIGVWETVKIMFPSVLLGKLLLLSIIPDLVLMFIFYKLDNFKFGGGVLLGAMAYLIASVLMMN